MCCSCSTFTFLTLFISSVILSTIIVSGVYIFQNDPQKLIMKENFTGKLFAIINMASEQSYSYLLRLLMNDTNIDDYDTQMFDPLDEPSSLDELTTEFESIEPATTTMMNIRTKVKNKNNNNKQKNRLKPRKNE
ncbi:uncharacterized protein LOC142646208 isoform X1 [Dermatophagoides pteronyssinus]|uniref:uncharacterized protein LOC142646208 isoform X1 n=1 Tax=Dermatophagoides pteronyssinus TaxID=6956 RepID=UPI003F67ED0E